MENTLKSYYEVLEASPQASAEEIKECYIKAKNAYSGDSSALYSLIGPEECKEILQEIEEAYSILSDHDKRIAYNKNKNIQVDLAEEISSLSNSKNNEDQYLTTNKLSDDQLLTSKDIYQQMHENSLSENDNFQLNETFKINQKEVEVSKISALNRFKLEYRSNDDFEREIESTVSFTGEFLKKIREYKNVTIDRMSDLTKISKTYIKQIESDDIEKLPAKAYVRGFVYQYAKCLKLVPDLVATSYLNHINNKKLS